MKKIFYVLPLVVMIFVFVGEDCSAADFGGQLSWANDTDLGLGGRVTFGLDQLDPNVEFIGAFDVFFPDGPVDYWEVNLNAAYNFPTEDFSPYLGGGLNIAHASIDRPRLEKPDDTELGVNILGGLKFNYGEDLTPFVELRGELGGGEQFVVSAGVLF